MDHLSGVDVRSAVVAITVRSDLGVRVAMLHLELMAVGTAQALDAEIKVAHLPSSCELTRVCFCVAFWNRSGKRLRGGFDDRSKSQLSCLLEKVFI